MANHLAYTLLYMFIVADSTMCDLLDKLENKGKYEANRETAKMLFANGASLELVIKSIPSLPKDEIQEIFHAITKKES